ncbi:SDR family oxidoreductase [uncultured Odoribacter sp.]|uniref:SDR family oxidoreductase n=1 Tax=uncultured Odoribacter sp. TaxID=876416 RepID=UPI00261BBB0C|nr:SDR family oxidoreductase [uncultured Odoribacter sp.]
MYIVTGANGGIGRAITETLARSGYRVIMACRNRQKAEQVRGQIAGLTGNLKIEVKELDLASFASVKRFAAQLLRQGVKIDALINNAGVMCQQFGLTEDGMERMLQVNYASPWLLTRLLLPAFSPGCRILNTSSCTYRLGKIDEHFFDITAENYSLFKIYGRSKLGVLLFTAELANRLEGREITVNAIDPGVVDTGMITMHRWFDPLTDLFFRPFIKSPQKGAATALHLILSEAGKTVNGGFWINKRLREMPEAVKKQEQRKKLWEMTENKLANYLKD